MWKKAFCSITWVLEYLLTYYVLPLCWKIKCCLLESDLFCNLDASIKFGEGRICFNIMLMQVISKFKMSIGGMSSKSADLVKIYYITNLDFPDIRGFPEISATFWGPNRSCFRLQRFASEGPSSRQCPGLGD